MKKRLLTLLMVSMMILSLAACKKSGSGEDTSLKDIQDKGTFVLGLDDTFAPMGFRDDNNEIVGFDIDLAKAVCEKLGVELKLQPIDWDAKQEELNTKNIDCIWNGLSLTKENQANMTMTPAYMNNQISLVVTIDSTIEKMADMAGKKLALQSSSSAEQTLDADDNKEFKESLAEVVPFDTFETALMDIDTANSDAVLMDSVMANYKIQKLGMNYKVLNDSLLDDNYSVGFRKGDQTLCDAVWDAMKELKKDGTVSEISTKWFGSDITTIE